MTIEGNIYDLSMSTSIAIDWFLKKLSFLNGHLYFCTAILYLKINKYINSIEFNLLDGAGTNII
jgi:hypothetical protein